MEIEFEEDDTLKEALMKNIKEEVEHLNGIVNNKIEVAVSKVKDDLNEEFKNHIKDRYADTEKMGDLAISISSLKNHVSGLQTNVSNNRTSLAT